MMSFSYKLSDSVRNRSVVVGASRGDQNIRGGQLHPEDQVIALLFRNYLLIFLSNRKMGAYNEHEFLKKAIPLYFQESVKVICVGSANNDFNLLDYLGKRNLLSLLEMSDILTPETLEKIKATIEARIKSKGTEEVE
jgi:hypothetical protein